jgi:hypothetical protein
MMVKGAIRRMPGGSPDLRLQAQTASAWRLHGLPLLLAVNPP